MFRQAFLKNIGLDQYVTFEAGSNFNFEGFSNFVNDKNIEQINNLLIKFKNDNLDQNDLLLKSLKIRPTDKSKIMQLEGNHLTPVSVGIREKFLKSNFQSSLKYEKIDIIVDQITHWKI